MAPGSLAEFAKQRGGVAHGWVEKTVEPDTLTEVDAGLEQGLSPIVIAEWLVTLGYEDATDDRVRGYDKRRRRG